MVVVSVGGKTLAWVRGSRPMYGKTVYGLRLLRIKSSKASQDPIASQCRRGEVVVFLAIGAFVASVKSG